METTKIKYKKGNVYQHTDNTEYLNTKEYEPEQVTIRELNPITEQYEYKTTIKNDKLDWENNVQMMEQLTIIDKEINKL